jgi:hypothetical protein
MSRSVLTLSLLAAVSGGAGSTIVLGQQPATTVLTEKHFDKEVSLKRGDILEIKLPAQMPIEWAQDKPNPILSPLKGYPKYVDAPPQPGNPNLVGAPGFTINRFEVVGQAAQPFELKLVYSKFGKPDQTARRIEQGMIPKPGDFRPDQKASDLREGMVYHVKLKIAP